MGMMSCNIFLSVTTVKVWTQKVLLKGARKVPMTTTRAG